MRTTRRRIGALTSAALPVLLSICAPVVAAARAVVARKASRPCPGADLRPVRTNAAGIGAATVCLINQLRRLHHLRVLGANRYLHRVATGQVRQMCAGTTSPTPLGADAGDADRLDRLRGPRRKLATGENIGWGTGADATPASMVAGWMASPSHRAVILARAFLRHRRGVWPRLPWSLGRGPLGAVYAVEFGARAR